jgi:hypothetical protein
MYIPSGIKAELASFSEGYFRGSHLIADQTAFKKENPYF